ncbi:MAG: hypothetical protein LBC76_10115 [Treponema sp.]|jgi:chromosome segregation ATPase|nr:hypothetical protein [Treponema sp.]
MKLLKRMLLIHWHYFVHEMVDFDKINFLTGKNSSGKSTIIDAMQLVLLSDTSGSFFNKAASGKGNRTLIGYLRGELGDDEKAGFRYLRDGRFTSYIVLEFLDDIKKSLFSAGCCFDTFGENDSQKLFFRFDGPIPENELVEQGIPFNIEKLRTFIRTNYTAGNYTTSVNRDFREDLCGKLGGLQTGRFTNLFKKAVSFNPDVDIRQFITEFVCGDEQKITIDDMKENIRSYDSLKKESIILKERVNLLTEIDNAFNEYIKNKESETLYNYLINRARWEIKKSDIEKYRQNALRLDKELKELDEKLTSTENEQKQLQEERDILKLQLDSNENARRFEELQKEIEEKTRRYNEIENEFKETFDLLRRTLSFWKSYITRFRETIAGINLSAVDPILKKRIETLAAEGKILLEKTELLRDVMAQDILKIGKDYLIESTSEAEDYRDRCSTLTDRLLDAQETAARHKEDLKKEKELLEKGVYKYPQDAIDLKEAIESRLRSKFGHEAKAFILAEAAEIRDDKWRNVIEGYLHTQKFYVIVAPEHFYTAFLLYDSIKRQKAVYATGLVDTEKLKNMQPSRDEGSLAEELESSNPAVRLFIDFILRRVRKCDSIRDLRKHRTAVTDDGVLYQNFVVRAMDPKRWKDPAIGQSGAKLKLEAVNREIAALDKELILLSAMISALKETGRFLRISEFEAEQIIQAAKQYIELPALKETIQRLSDDAVSIDRSEIEILIRRLEERKEAITKTDAKIRQLAEERGSALKELKICNEETLPRLENEESVLRSDLEASFDKDWIEKTGGTRYDKEFSERKSAEEILKAFPREQSRSQNAKTEAWNRTNSFRLKYNDTYKTGYDVNAQDNDVFRKIRLEYAEIKLPEYEAKIEDTRRKAFQQFQEDFLSKLQSNIFNAKRHIDELNASMRGASFGEDIYQFRMTSNPEFKRYYDMIVDEMLLVSGYSLSSEQFNAKYKEEIRELFEMLTNGGGMQNASVSEDYEKRVQAFTDYKTYLQFDLEVTKPNGESERLSKTMGKKSGGETQTPFYIAVLASFVQLYRVGRDKVPNTSRLILFDEAFSKMDGERIIQSIDLLRRFQFQVVFAAPPDKIPDIATLADRNLCVLREGHKACVRPFDPRELGELANEE